MKLIIALIIASVSAPLFAQYTQVKGYQKKNGAYVSPHIKTKSNNTTYDNLKPRGSR